MFKVFVLRGVGVSVLTKILGVSKVKKMKEAEADLALERVAWDARLDLSDEEKVHFYEQIKELLTHLKQLNDLAFPQLEGYVREAHKFYPQRFQKPDLLQAQDCCLPPELTAEEVLALAPQVVNQQVALPLILP